VRDEVVTDRGVEAQGGVDIEGVEVQGGVGRGSEGSRRGGEREAPSTSGGGKPRRALGCDRSIVRLRTFGGGKPRLGVTFNICVRRSDQEPRRRGSPRCVASVMLLVPATPRIGDNATLRGGLPAPNVQRPAKLLITAQRAAGLAEAPVLGSSWRLVLALESSWSLLRSDLRTALGLTRARRPIARRQFTPSAAADRDVAIYRPDVDRDVAIHQARRRLR
jgi:hypothetical protein